MELPMNMFPADFIGVNHVRQRSVYKFSFELDEDMAEVALQMLGGLPKEGESRSVLIWRPDLKDKESVKEGLLLVENLKARMKPNEVPSEDQPENPQENDNG